MGFQEVIAGAIRVILFGLNFTTLLAGGVLLGTGAYVKIAMKEFLNSVQDAQAVETVAYMVIGLGCLVVVLSLVGCLGACLQNQHLLGCYFVLMLLLLLFEISIGILFGVKKGTLEKQIDVYVKETIENANSTSAEMQVVNVVQEMLSCCGLDGATDYNNRTDYPALPPSCCEGDPAACTKANAYSRGCKQEIDKFIDSQSVLVIIVVCSVVLLEVTTMLAACYLRRRELQDIDHVISDPPYSM